MKPPELPPTHKNLIDFSKPPQKIQEYKIGEQITRDNFISFLITSFAISRGDSDCQRAFFLWLEKMYKIDALGLIKDLLADKEEHRLSQEEIKKFGVAMSRVETDGHRQVLYINDRIMFELTSLVSKSVKDFDVEHILTLHDFKEVVDKFIKQRREKRKSSI